MRLTLWAIVVAAAGAAFNWVFGEFFAPDPLYGLLFVAAPVLEIAAAVWLFLSARRSDAWSARRLGIAVGLAVAALLDGACWLIIAASL
ncbi:MAG TPA: hypothetical protein VEI02_16230 [Planctomycetota bacterium]|nr:hypothetical protein [Planctomycetota bacterium]